MNKRKTLLDRREREKKKNTTIWWWWWWSGRRRRRKRRHWHTQKEREEAALENNASSHLLTYLDISRRKIAGTIQHTHTRTSVKCTTYRNDDKHLERKRSRFQSQASDRWKEKKNSASAVGILLREFRTRLKYLPSTGGVWICAKAASWIRSLSLSFIFKKQRTLAGLVYVRHGSPPPVFSLREGGLLAYCLNQHFQFLQEYKKRILLVLLLLLLLPPIILFTFAFFAWLSLFDEPAAAAASSSSSFKFGELLLHLLHQVF